VFSVRQQSSHRDEYRNQVMEVEMIGKITAAATAAIVLASAGAAFAQGNAPVPPHGVRQSPYQAAYADPYFNKTYWDAIAPRGKVELRDPYVGTVWESVVPY
jgi:hypothetical protein